MSSPCRFGVRIVLLQPPACRKRRLKGGVRGSLVATSTAARCQGPTPARAEILIEFSAPCAPLFRLWDHNIGYQRLIPSTTTFWSSAWRGLMVFVRLHSTGSVPIYSIADNRYSTTEFHHRFVVSPAGARRVRCWGRCYFCSTRQTLVS